MITTHCLQDFTKKCKTLFNRTVRNCILHPWLLFLSAHLKPILFSEGIIMSNEYTWIWICHHMCIFTRKIARLHAHVFIYTEKILTKFYYHHYHHCILHHCSLHVCLFTIIFISVFVLSFLLLSFFLYHLKDSSEMLYMLFFHRHSPFIDCKIVIRDVFSFSL